MRVASGKTYIIGEFTPSGSGWLSLGADDDLVPIRIEDAGDPLTGI